MSTPWLVLDVNGLCWRAYHSTGGLSYHGTPTGVTFGFLGEILRLQSHFETDRIVFCFDRGESLRSKLCKTYKYNRIKKKKEATDHEKEMYDQIRRQITDLRKKHLPAAGFKNVFSQKGYEADDIIASVCHNLQPDDTAVVVSSDKDMFQLISKRVSVWRPKEQELWTKRKFIGTYGIVPKDWAWVKAIAGCSSDEVQGIPGIGEIRALQYIKRTINPSSGWYKAITDKAARRIIIRNLPLVTLPFEGCKDFVPKPDGKIDWKPIYEKLGIRSLDPNKKVVYKQKERKRG